MSIYTEAEKKILIEALITSFERSNKREGSIIRSRADKEVAIDKVYEMRDDGTPFPTDSGYESYEVWAHDLTKRTTTDSNSLNKIEEQKVMIEALEFYLENKA